MRKSKMWTVDEMEQLVKAWDKKTYDELSEILDRDKTSIGGMVCQLRKQGIPMSKKWKNGQRNAQFIELKKRLKIK